MKRLAAVLVAVAALVAACGNDSDSVSTPEGPAPNPPAGADELVIQVTTGGGLIAPQSLAVEIPAISVFGDGTFIVPGPTTLEYPGPALPNLQQGRLRDGEVERLLNAARDAGLLDDEPPDFGDPGVTDMPSTTILIDAGGAQHRVSIYALDFVEGDSNLDDNQRAARDRVREFVDSLPGDAATDPYAAGGFAVLVRPYIAADVPGAGQADWPLGDLAGAGEPIEAFGSDTRCLVVTGTDAEAVLAVAADAREGARWRSNGVDYSLTFRPLLPHETGCESLRPEFGGA